METVGHSCPDPEALAAWLDRGLSATESAEIDAHVAGCDDCRFVVAHVLETQSAVQEPVVVAATAPATEPLVPRFSTKKLGWGLASVLAAAAMLSLALDMPPSRWLWGGRSIDSKLADLAAAVGTERTIEPRLTGGFAYGPLRAAVRSGGSSAVPDDWTLYAAAGRIREDTDRDPTAENLHALGLAHLVLGQHDEAVRALEDAVAEEPQNGRYQSDLAGAYLARARQNDRPDDVPRALGAAERALKADDALLEARFNRALALEALFLEDQARQAWEDYLARDSSSQWASEARTHVQRLQQAMPPPDLARNNSPPPIGDTSVEAGLDWLLREGLSRWADAVVAKDAGRAAAEHLSLTTYAKQISDASGDPFAADLVALTATTANASGVAVQFQALGRGLRRWDSDDVPGAEKELRLACAGNVSVLSTLCDVELGTLDVMHRDEAQARHRSTAALSAAKTAGHMYIAARAQRLDGYRLMFQGDYPAAAAEYLGALNRSETANYQRQVANLSSQLADLHDLLGLPIDAWRWRHRGLQASARSASNGQLYVTLLTTSTFLARKGEFEAARAFSRVDEHRFANVGSLQRVIALVEQSKAALADGDLVAARQGIDAATAVIAQSSDFRAERIRPLLGAIEAAVLQLEGNRTQAHAVIDGVLSSLGPERALYKPGALLQRARLRVELSQDAAAERDVEDAISLLASRSSVSQPIQLADANGAFDAIAALVAARPALHTSVGILLAERLREILDGVPEHARLTSSQAVDEALRRDDQAIAIYFLFGDHTLLTWVATRDGVRFLQRPIDARHVQRLAALLRVQVARGPGNEDKWRQTLSNLYDLVLRDVPGVESAERIMVVPDGPLSAVPFGSLLDSRTGQFLFERATVRMASNLAFATEETAVARSTSDISVLAIGEPAVLNAAASGFPPLVGAREEAYRVAALYPRASVLVGDAATKNQVLAKLPLADVVHFAGHAVAGSSDGRSRLLLAGSATEPRNALTDTDLVGRVTRARVVLAACETAADATERTAGAATITAAFLRAGADSVIATLWQLDDVASEPFFLEVHRALVSGVPASLALARAQRACYASTSCRAAPATWIGTAAYGLE